MKLMLNLLSRLLCGPVEPDATHLRMRAVLRKEKAARERARDAGGESVRGSGEAVRDGV